MSRSLSQTVADLFAKPAEGKDLSSQIQRLGAEVRNVVQSEDTVFGKFHGLLRSLQEIIPDEQQRYQAALKALSTTAKLSRQEIIKAVNDQIEEMRIVEKGLMPSLSGWRDDLKAGEARAQERKDEMAKLRERIAQLENEEKAGLAARAKREKDLASAEKTIQDIFAGIRDELASLGRKVAELPAESPAAQPVPQAAPVKSAVPAEKKESGDQKSVAQAAPAPLDPKFQRKCPMCGGQFNLLEFQNIWQCFSCAYEEPTAGGARGGSEEKREPVNAPLHDPDPGPASGQLSSVTEPAASPAGEFEWTNKEPSPSGSQPIKKKPCPACKRKMFWYPEEKAWRCPDCGYERRI